jgi:ketosteroid isomerase-like protein
MSQENVSLIQRVYEEYGRTGDVVRWALAWDVEWHTAADLPDTDVHRGIESVAAFVRDWPSAFEDFGAEVEEFIDIGDCVVVPLVLRGRVRGTDEAVAMRETHVWKLREAKVIEVREYRTREQALEAVGLRE